MRRFPDTTRRRSRIEIIPMIDVMMFLLVFFVLISINVIPALGLKTKLPVSTQASVDAPPKRLVITLPREGGVLLEGVPFDGPGMLEEAFRKRKADAAPVRLAVIVNGDESVPLQRLIDVMDAAKSAGIEALTFAARRP